MRTRALAHSRERRTRAALASVRTHAPARLSLSLYLSLSFSRSVSLSYAPLDTLAVCVHSVVYLRVLSVYSRRCTDNFDAAENAVVNTEVFENRFCFTSVYTSNRAAGREKERGRETRSHALTRVTSRRCALRDRAVSSSLSLGMNIARARARDEGATIVRGSRSRSRWRSIIA